MTKVIICANCGKERKCYAKGLCKICYSRHWRKENPKRTATHKRRYNETHREKILAYGRHWREEHRGEMLAYNHRYQEEHEEEIAIQRHHYYENHRDEILAYQRRYREDHGEERADCIRRWQQENPERLATIFARRKARKSNLPNTLTPEQARQLFIVGQATYPGEKLQLDHFVPLVAGGGTTFANMHAIPTRLNQSKNDGLPQEIYRQIILI